MFRGAFLVGHAAPAPLALETAALLVCGPRSALSHETAASRIWGVLRETPAVMHVTVGARGRRSRPGLAVHHTVFAPGDVRERQGLRVTSPIRTLADLAPLLDPVTLERAANEAQALGLVTPAQLSTGPPALRALAAQPGITRSEAERELLRLLRRAGLTPDRTNVRLAGHEVDALFREQRLVVEVDGFAFHRTRTAFEHDHLRDMDLAAAGYRVARISWRQLTKTPELVAARLAAALATAG